MIRASFLFRKFVRGLTYPKNMLLLLIILQNNYKSNRNETKM